VRALREDRGLTSYTLAAAAVLRGGGQKVRFNTYERVYGVYARTPRKQAIACVPCAAGDAPAGNDRAKEDDE
jgi:hypothetical protein